MYKDAEAFHVLNSAQAIYSPMYRQLNPDNEVVLFL
jgi:hypothetical protein